MLGRGTRDRELRETRQSWDAVQERWRALPFATEHPSVFVSALVLDAMRSAERVPSIPILVSVAEAVEGLLAGEDVGDIEPCWPVVDSDVEAALEFRQMLARRRRWACDFRRMSGIFRRVVAANIRALFGVLPDACFAETEPGANDAFEVTLLDLLDDPVAAVEQLLLLPYDDEALHCHVFDNLRERLVTNVLVASGFPPSDNPAQHQGKLILPSRQKNKTARELADAYLGGTPLHPILDVSVPFSIPEELRFEHCHIVGGTGHGKTQLMQKLIHADLVAAQRDGRSVVVIDSQGDLISKLVRLDLFSPATKDSLADRLVIIDPADVEFPAALNLFDAHLDRVRTYGPADRERVLNGVIELYELFFGSFLGAELTQKQGVIFKYLARLMLAVPEATIHTLMQVMEDGQRFKPYMEQLDGSARYFFESEFFHPSFTATKKQILRRLWGVLSTPAFERMFTQPRNKLDLFEAMNAGKIILVNTAKDLLKREGSQLLGRFFIAMITQAALERSTIPERRRTPTFVYVDEAQEYFDDSIETILNQARKYRVSLTLAHQTLDQLSPRLRSAILANTSMKCAGGVSAKDARTLADELRTTSDFIESMRRRGERTEFAVWVRHLTGQAIRLSVPLGFLERQPTLDMEELGELVGRNRVAYCGTLADMARPALPPVALPAPIAERPKPPSEEPPRSATVAAPEALRPPAPPRAERPPPGRPPLSATMEEHPFGKGGRDHRYLQALAKELAEQHGIRATIEAPLPTGSGQVDVLLERDGVVAAIEISVSTPVAHEIANLRKCLDAGYPRIAVILAKSKKTRATYKAALIESMAPTERERVSFLAPEELPDFIAGLALPPQPEERVVKGYRVKGTMKATSIEDAKVRRDAVAKLLARPFK
jgi:Type IV secretion-system coupling protein DNA-binding domain